MEFGSAETSENMCQVTTESVDQKQKERESVFPKI